MKRYDSNLAGRQHNLLSTILRPRPFPTDALAWEDALMQWKREVRRWEQITNDFLPDSVQCTVLLENAPSHVRAQLALQGHTTSEALETAILSYLGVQRFLQQSGGGGASTMEVDAVTKGKPKGKDKGKGKGKPKGETRTCNNCGKVGHLRAECWAPGGGSADAAPQNDKGKDGKKKSRGKRKRKRRAQRRGRVLD